MRRSFQTTSTIVRTVNLNLQSTIHNPLIIIEIDVVNDLISFYFSVIRDS